MKNTAVCKVCAEVVPFIETYYDASMGESLGLVCSDCNSALDDYLLNHAACLMSGLDKPEFTD